jgi:hypothetical protein
MNNNPVKMLFELSDTAVDVMDKYTKTGIILSNEQTQLNRMHLCAECKSFEPELARCKLCGCLMKIKVRIDAARCPIGKW